MSTLVVLVGQSENLTFGTTPAELPAGTAPDPHAQIWNWKAQGFETMDPGHNTNAGFPAYVGSWGPEVGYFNAEHAAHPDEVVYFLKDHTIQGETGIAKDPNAWDWSPESRGEQWDKATVQVLAAKAAIPDLTRVVVLLAEGEKDSTNPEAAKAYGANLTDFVAHMKADWGVDVVVMDRIADEWGADNPVRAAQDALGAFSTDDYPMQADGRHYNGEGALMLGHDFWLADQAATTPAPVVHDPPRPISLDFEWEAVGRSLHFSHNLF